MIVAGLDLSLTSAGIAVLDNGQPRVVTHVGHTSRDGNDYQQRSRRVRSQCQAVLNVLRAKVLGGITYIDLAVIEGPLHHGPQQAYEWDRAQLWGGVFGALDAVRVPIAVINPSTLKVWFTGDGTATKLRMLDTARGLFREAISTHDEADAIALACAGAHHLSDPIPFEPTERQQAAHTRIEWPEQVPA